MFLDMTLCFSKSEKEALKIVNDAINYVMSR